MLRFLADENFNRRILRGLQRRLPELDVVRVQDASLGEQSDPALLEWAAEQNRVITTHDIATMVGYAYDQVEASCVMPGVIAVATSLSIGQVVADLELFCQAGNKNDVENAVVFLPLT